MLNNYIKVAIRNIARNKLYALINILGLSMGLAIYLFGGLLSDYEHSHDSFFENFDRVYTVRGIVSSQSTLGISQIDGVQAAVGPLL